MDTNEDIFSPWYNQGEKSNTEKEVTVDNKTSCNKRTRALDLLKEPLKEKWKNLCDDSFYFDSIENIFCDYVILKCVYREPLLELLKIYNDFLSLTNNGEVKLLTSFSKNSNFRYDSTNQAVIELSPRKKGNVPFLLYIPGRQAQKFLKYVLFDETVRKLCNLNNICLNRLDVKCICTWKKNHIRNGENHLNLKTKLNETVLNKRRALNVSMMDESIESTEITKQIEKKGTTTYIKDYKYTRRIYNYVGDNEVHFELEQKNETCLKPYNKIYTNSTKNLEDFVKLMDSNFKTEFDMVVSHPLTDNFLNEVLKKEVKVTKEGGFYFHGLMKYHESDPEKVNLLLVSDKDEFVVDSQMLPVLEVLYGFFQLMDENDEVKFKIRDIVSCLGWEYTKETINYIVKSIDILYCSSYLINTKNHKVKGRLILKQEILGQREPTYILKLDEKIIRESLTSRRLDHEFLRELQLSYKEEFKRRKFPTGSFYKIYTFLSETCYETDLKFPYKVPSNYKSQQEFLILFDWMLKKFYEKSKLTQTLFEELKAKCQEKRILKES